MRRLRNFSRCRQRRSFTSTLRPLVRTPRIKRTATTRTRPQYPANPMRTIRFHMRSSGLPSRVRRVGARFRRAADDRGFIIVAVLWILGLLAALVSIYAVYVANAGLSLSVNDDRLQAEALTSSALELV